MGVSEELKMQSGYGHDVFSAPKTVDTRARFISRTYNHLFGAIVAFAAIEFALFTTGLAVPIAQPSPASSGVTVPSVSCPTMMYPFSARSTCIASVP